VPSEKTLVTFGIFNAGIIGVRRSEESIAFLEWWKEWMLDPRHLVFTAGYDQVWLNYAPIYCLQMKVLRDPSYNVAFWNLHERGLTVGDDGIVRCGKEQLTAYHFSYFNPDYPEHLVWPVEFSGHAKYAAIDSLTADMLAKWHAAGRQVTQSWGYGFSQWPDGTCVSEAQRELVKLNWDTIPTRADPWTMRAGVEKLYKPVRPQVSSDQQGGMKEWLRKMLGISPLAVIRKIRSLYPA
jgi:hypothetical protein